jgi:hypothetical protein
MADLDRSADELALRRLAACYARGADRREPETYAGVFLPDGAMRVYRLPDTQKPMTDMVGHGQLARVPGMLAKNYSRTFHFLGQSLYDIGEEEATGEVYCLAHHLSADRHGGTSYVMHMRYEDRYRHDKRHEWKMAERVAWIDWTETRAANPPGT